MDLMRRPRPVDLPEFESDEAVGEQQIEEAAMILDEVLPKDCLLERVMQNKMRSEKKENEDKDQTRREILGTMKVDPEVIKRLGMK
jgi:hypothetical protein